MSGFLWESGHLGWGIFAVVVFSGLWVVLADLCWRLTDIRFRRLLATMAAGWAIGVALVVLCFYLVNG